MPHGNRKEVVKNLLIVKVLSRGAPMNARRLLFGLLVSMGLASVYGAEVLTAQASPANAPAAQAPARGSAAPAPARGTASGRNVYGTLAQVMRAIPFPNSNIIFDVQDNDPATKKPDPNGPYLGQYQGWEGVENAGIALAEVATLVLLPGRVCSNGKPVPLGQADFVQYRSSAPNDGNGDLQRGKDSKSGCRERPQRQAHRDLFELP